jgi:hypothetical protein
LIVVHLRRAVWRTHWASSPKIAGGDGSRRLLMPSREAFVVSVVVSTGGIAGASRLRLAIARGNQFRLELRPFIGCRGGILARRRQIFYIDASVRASRLLPRIHY